MHVTNTFFREFIFKIVMNSNTIVVILFYIILLLFIITTGMLMIGGEFIVLAQAYPIDPDVQDNSRNIVGNVLEDSSHLSSSGISRGTRSIAKRFIYQNNGIRRTFNNSGVIAVNSPRAVAENFTNQLTLDKTHNSSSVDTVREYTASEKFFGRYCRNSNRILTPDQFYTRHGQSILEENSFLIVKSPIKQVTYWFTSNEKVKTTGPLAQADALSRLVSRDSNILNPISENTRVLFYDCKNSSSETSIKINKLLQNRNFNPTLFDYYKLIKYPVVIDDPTRLHREINAFGGLSLDTSHTVYYMRFTERIEKGYFEYGSDGFI